MKLSNDCVLTVNNIGEEVVVLMVVTVNMKMTGMKLETVCNQSTYLVCIVVTLSTYHPSCLSIILTLPLFAVNAFLFLPVGVIHSYLTSSPITYFFFYRRVTDHLLILCLLYSLAFFLIHLGNKTS